MALTVEEIEGYFYSDLDGELVLEKFSAPSVSELLSEYNLGLTQNTTF